MEAYSGANSSSKTANSYHYHSMLHSVRKSQAKPWRKAPVAPLPPTPVKVYKVDPINFRDLVQQLTGAPEFKPQHLQSVAPSTATSLDVASPSNPAVSSRANFVAAASSPLILPPKIPMSSWYHDGEAEAQRVKTPTAMAPAGFLELNLSSSSSYNWRSFLPPMMSPGTMTSLEAGRVL